MSSRAPLLAVLVVLSFFAGLTGVRLAYTLAYALVLLLAVAWAWSMILARRVEVRRQPPEGAHMVGEAFTERFTIRNRSILTLPTARSTTGPGWRGTRRDGPARSTRGGRWRGRRGGSSPSGAS